MAHAEKGYAFFDHTADIGIRAVGTTLAEVLIGLGQGLTELLIEDSQLEARETRPIVLTAKDAESLTLQWMQELLFWFSTDRFVPVIYELETVTPTSVQGRVRGDRFDPMRHTQGREVKAITRHALEVQERDGQWSGQVIVDI
mgnify:CR=1 FL=1